MKSVQIFIRLRKLIKPDCSDMDMTQSNQVFPHTLSNSVQLNRRFQYQLPKNVALTPVICFLTKPSKIIAREGQNRHRNVSLAL